MRRLTFRYNPWDLESRREAIKRSSDVVHQVARFAPHFWIEQRHNPRGNSYDVWLIPTSNVEEKALLILWSAFSEAINADLEIETESDVDRYAISQASAYERKVSDRFGI